MIYIKKSNETIILSVPHVQVDINIVLLFPITGFTPKVSDFQMSSWHRGFGIFSSFLHAPALVKNFPKMPLPKSLMRYTAAQNDSIYYIVRGSFDSLVQETKNMNAQMQAVGRLMATVSRVWKKGSIPETIKSSIYKVNESKWCTTEWKS